MKLQRVLSIGVFAFINLVFGFFGQWLVFFVLGVGRQTDALYATMGLPQMLFVIMTGPLISVLSPKLAAMPPAESRRQASAAATLIAVAFAPIFVLLFVFASTWTAWLIPGLAQEYGALLTVLARVHLVGVALSTAYGIAWAAVASRRRFVVGEAALAVVSIVCAAAIYPVAKQWGVLGIASLFSVRTFARFAVLVPIAGLVPTFRFRGAGLRTVFMPAVLPTLTASYHSSEQVFDRYIMSLAPAGLLSLFNLGLSLLSAAFGILNRALLAPLAPELGVLAKQRDIVGLRATVNTYVRAAAGIGVTGLLGLALVGRPVLGILVGHGGITPDNVVSLWQIMLALGGILAGNASLAVYSQGLFALGETTLASIAFSAAFTVGLFVKAMGFYAFGVLGLGIGTSGYYLLATLIYAALFYERCRHHEGGRSPVETPGAVK